MQAEILQQIKKLTTAERLAIIEVALELSREDLKWVERPLAQTERKRQLAAASEALFQDYSADVELIAFTSLDSEDFRAHGRKSPKDWQLS
jgi:hypothetical protein